MANTEGKKSVRKRYLIISIALLTTLVFLLTFGIAFYAIHVTPSPVFHDRVYSIPESDWSSPEIDAEGIGNFVGPPLNATDVPLDTVVFLSTMRAFSPEDVQLHMSPEAAVLRKELDVDQNSPGGAIIWYFAEPLKPTTTYTATIIRHDIPTTWNFTTTDEPFQPRYDKFPNQLGQIIAVSMAVVASVISIPVIWKATFMKRWKNSSPALV